MSVLVYFLCFLTASCFFALTLTAGELALSFCFLGESFRAILKGEPGFVLDGGFNYAVVGVELGF